MPPLLLAVAVAGCSTRHGILQESLKRLDWSGGDSESRYVRDLLVDSVQESRPSDLEHPRLINASYKGRHPEMQDSILAFDWIANPPGADGVLLTMQDGSSLAIAFHQAHLNENQRESQHHAICQAVVLW